MRELSPHEIRHVAQRIPPFELSYEITKHNTVWTPTDDPQQLTLHIPMGRKALLWFTFYERNNGCFLMELNRDKTPVKVWWLRLPVSEPALPLTWFYGTLLYGTLVSRGLSQQQQQQFYADDIYRFHGYSIANYTVAEKWSAIRQTFVAFAPFYSGASLPAGSQICSPHTSAQFCMTLPVLNGLMEPDYAVHHIQTRHLVRPLPYLNYLAKPMTISATTNAPISATDKPFEKNTKKPQYKVPTVFRIMANVSYDLYSLYAYGLHSTPIFYDYACIQDLPTSRMMNQKFRRIRENSCMDSIEESDDEADEAPAHFVDLKKAILMKCVFHRKFKKWIPVEEVSGQTRVVHISAL